MKISRIYRIARLGKNFDEYPGFPATAWYVYTFATECMSRDKLGNLQKFITPISYKKGFFVLGYEIVLV